jgi:hypothetical protein
MSTTVAVAPEPSPERPLSEASRLINSVISPSETFRDIKRSAAFWVPLLLIAITQILFTYTVDKKVGFAQVAENNVRMNAKQAEAFDRLPADQRERQMRGMTMGMKYFSYAFPVFWLVVMLIVSGVLLATFNFGLGAEVKFKQALAIVIYAGFAPGIVRSLLGILSLMAGLNPESFNIQNPVGTNVGYYLGPGVGAFLYGITTSLDVMMFWTLALTGIGFACVSKVKTGTAMAVAFGWWFGFSLLMSGIGALAS